MTPTLRTLNAEIDRCDQTEIEREARLKVLADFMLRNRREILTCPLRGINCAPQSKRSLALLRQKVATLILSVTT